MNKAKVGSVSSPSGFVSKTYGGRSKVKPSSVPSSRKAAFDKAVPFPVKFNDAVVKEPYPTRKVVTGPRTTRSGAAT